MSSKVSPETLKAWAIPGLVLVAVCLSSILWVAAGVVSLLHAHGWPATSWSPLLAITLARQGWSGVWPGLPAWQVLLVAAILITPIVTPLAWWLAHNMLRAADPSLAMAKRGEVRALTPAQTEANARRLRPSLAEVPKGQVRPRDTGTALGRLLPRGPQLRASWEDVIIAVMAPRSGKTTSLAIPAILDAPGPVIATSNKADLWSATSQIRGSSTREQVWLFDPQSITHQTQDMWWDPLEGLQSVEDADRLAGMFVLTVEDKNAKDIWGPAAKEMLAALFMAAKVGNGTIVDAYRWLNDLTQRPATLLHDAGFPALASSLEGFQRSPAETRGSVVFTAKVAVQCLREPEITKWVTPPTSAEAVHKFDPTAFAQSRQTLYLLSKDGGGGAAPLVAALTDRLMRQATIAAEKQGGRLDPPMVIALDEAANICRIGDLPELYSHLGSRGVLPITILQSYAQGTRVWGDAGMRTLWSAATIKLIGSGIDDASFAEDLSRLIGDHETISQSHNSGGGGRSSVTTSERRERILPAAQIRALPKGQAIVLATGLRPAMVKLQPWWEGPHASTIRQSSAASIDLITRQVRTEQPA